MYSPMGEYIFSKAQFCVLQKCFVGNPCRFVGQKWPPLHRLEHPVLNPVVILSHLVKSLLIIHDPQVNLLCYFLNPSVTLPTHLTLPHYSTHSEFFFFKFHKTVQLLLAFSKLLLSAFQSWKYILLCIMQISLIYKTKTNTGAVVGTLFLYVYIYFI